MASRRSWVRIPSAPPTAKFVLLTDYLILIQWLGNLLWRNRVLLVPFQPFEPNDELGRESGISAGL